MMFGLRTQWLVVEAEECLENGHDTMQEPSEAYFTYKRLLEG